MKKDWKNPVVEELEIRASKGGGADRTSIDGEADYCIADQLLTVITYNPSHSV